MKKIMFNDRFGLTKAVLEGRKTMTRRVAKPISENIDKLIFGKLRNGENPYNGGVIYFLDRRIYKPAIKLGEVVAIAQSYKDIAECVYGDDEMWELDFILQIEDAYELLHSDIKGWNNKMFVRADLMPYQIRITNVRMERLQDISDGDCLREGVIRYNCNLYEFRGICYSFDGDMAEMGTYLTAREAFAALIDKVSGKGTWESNPWVFVYDFELVR